MRIFVVYKWWLYSLVENYKIMLLWHNMLPCSHFHRLTSENGSCGVRRKHCALLLGHDHGSSARKLMVSHGTNENYGKLNLELNCGLEYSRSDLDWQNLHAKLGTAGISPRLQHRHFRPTPFCSPCNQAVGLTIWHLAQRQPWTKNMTYCEINKEWGRWQVWGTYLEMHPRLNLFASSPVSKSWLVIWWQLLLCYCRMLW